MTLRAPPPIRGIDRARRSCEVVFTSGEVLPYEDRVSGPYEVQLSLRDGACRLDRMRSGRMHLLDSHGKTLEDERFALTGGAGPTRLDLILGVVEDGWIEAGSRGIARLRFAETPLAENRWRMVLEGALVTVSQSWRTAKLLDITPPGASMRRLLVTSWEPTEISLVATPRDGGAGVLASFPSELQTNP